jgi:predicted TIM-barrel fold metal-dependent hydrolase
MIIDFHVHPTRCDSYTESYRTFLHTVWGERAESALERYATPEAFLNLMDESGVACAVILAELSPVTTGMCTNERVAEFCSKSPRLIPFASINPFLCTSVARELERLVKDFGFRGVKLYPTYHFYYPNDNFMYPLYAKAEELGIPISMHLGSSVFTGSRMKYGQPILIDDVAVDFPGLPLLMCHCGRPFWYNEAFGLARLHKNVYLELSGLPPQKLLTYFPELERVADKAIYGSDFPGVASMAENIKTINSLAITQEAKEKILGKNGARLLKIEAGASI